MAKNQKEYKRLRGTGRGLASFNRLYLGTDHLLSITSNYMSEDYHRFYYKDIQALITRKTYSGRTYNIIYGFFFICFLVPIYWLDQGLAVFFLIMAGSFSLLLLINWLRGPTCVTYIMTPVQTLRLKSLNRVKIVNRAMNSLKPLIEGIQGALSREELSKIYQEAEPQPTLLTPLITSLKHESGNFHNFLFSLISIEAIFIFIEIYYQDVFLTLLSTLTIMAVTILLIIALVKQAGSDMNKAVKIISWSTIPYLSFGFIVGYIIFFYIVIKNPTVGNNQWELIKLVSALSPNEHPLLMGYSIFSLLFSLMLGIPGLILTIGFQKAHKSALQTQAANTPLTIESDHE